MPAVHNVLDCTTPTSWFGDVDVGEMFLNFPLDLALRPFCGVYLSWMNEKGKTTWESWHRMAMGMKPSPWVTCRLLAWMMEFVMGDKADTENPFRWDSVVLNLPGDPGYDPNMPRVYTWNALLQAISCDVKCFVDDCQIMGPTKASTVLATHRLETRMSYLGIQDATRKRRKITQRPGEWTGSIVVAVSNVGLFASVSQKKWDKVKAILKKWKNRFEHNNCPKLSLKELERDVGFLVHLSMAYPLIKPVLRRFYLTMNAWREDRDGAGWKMPRRTYQTFLALSRRSGEVVQENHFRSNKNAPMFVDPKPLFLDHLKMLVDMFESDEPALRLVRGHQSLQAMYAFGDASGGGFGASWVKQGSTKFRYGIWSAECEDSSSNYRELRNLIDSLEVMGSCGDLTGRELFFFTDNSTAEHIARKGSSTSPILFQLVVRLYKMGMKFKCDIKFIHVSGKRMIAQGTDGLSRGDLLEGVMKGHSILDFVPLNETALERSPQLGDWVRSWAEVPFHEELEILSHEDWLWRGQDINGTRQNIDGYSMPSYKAGTFLWSPAPGAALFAVEALRQGRHKRQESFHIWIVPRLLTGEWRKNMLKAADLIVEVPTGSHVWPEDMFEPLTLALFFPYLTRKPWELRRSGLMVDMEGKLRLLFQKSAVSGGRLLSELCLVTRSLESMPIRELHRMLQS